MNGLMIESRPLTAEGAVALIGVLDKATIVATSAVGVLELRLSLARIAEGQDAVMVKAQGD